MTKGWSPCPNVVIDEVMVRLRDTELRILLIIIRETLGRSDSEGGRLKRAWLSQAYLKKRTGRQSEAISKAIDVLCQSGLIQVYDSLGRPLSSRRSRRFNRGRLRFSLHPSLAGEIGQKRTSKTEH